MGNCLLLLGLKKEKRPVTLLLVGLDSAGKTTAAKGIVGDPAEDVAPTVGFAPEYLEYRGCEVTIYDLGGGAKIRPVWAKYFSEVHGVIFVVDSSAAARVQECHAVLQALLSDPKIAGKPVLILANKQDVEGAMDEIDLVEGLKVEEIVNRYKCPTRVETCSAVATRNRKPDKPIADGFRWLVDTIVVHYKEINKRVVKDMEREREIQRREMEERKERLKELRLQREAQAAAAAAGRGGGGGGGGEEEEEEDNNVAAVQNSSSPNLPSPQNPTSSSPPPPPPPPQRSSSSSSSPPSSSPPPSSVVTKAEVVMRKEEEEEEEEEEKASSSKVPNGSLPQGTRRVRITSAAERQELRELGFESSGELAGSTSSTSSSTSSSISSSSSLVKVPASTATTTITTATTTTTTTTAASPPPHRLIMVKESSPPPPPQHHPATTTVTTTTTTTTTSSSSPSAVSVTSGGQRSHQLELSSERRHSECIPIDSDDELFDLDLGSDLPPATFNPDPAAAASNHHHHLLHHHHHLQNNFLQNGSANHNNNNNSTSGSQLELESAAKPNKKKSFLRRYHKTAPLLTRDCEVHPQHA